MGGKGTVITNTTQQGPGFVRIVQHPDHAPDTLTPGMLVHCDQNETRGQTFALSFDPATKTYSISGSGSSSTGVVALNGKKVGTQDIYRVKRDYTPKAGTTPTYELHPLTSGLGESASFSKIYNSDGTIYGADFVGATLPGSGF